MVKIVRTETRAEGGITPEERRLMRDNTKKWISNALSTEPVNRKKLTAAIEGLYHASGLKKPRVVVVPSPLVMAFAGGLASAVWFLRKNPAYAATSAETDEATYAATSAATHAATHAATRAATSAATYAATYAATSAETLAATSVATYEATLAATSAETHAATHAATRAETDEATYETTIEATSVATNEATSADRNIKHSWLKRLAIALSTKSGGSTGFYFGCISKWHNSYQGGNMWSSVPSFLSSARDILGLKLPEHKKYAAWEECAKQGGFRWMHKEFCIVSDRPELLLLDENNKAHAEDGPSHRWRDGFFINHWHGIKLPDDIWTEPLTPQKIDNEKNAEVSRAMMEIYGMDRYLEEIQAVPLDSSEDGFGRPVELFQLPGQELPIVRVVNSSPEPDGAHRRYVLTATRKTRDPVDAVASLAGTTAEHYIPLIES